MSHSVHRPPDLPTLQYIITHIFCPLQLPDGDDHTVSNDHSLAATVSAVARLYTCHVDENFASQWHSISRMLDNLQATVQFESMDESQTLFQLSGMVVGDVLAFFIRAQNAAVLFRKHKTGTLFESFEVSPKAESVVTTRGKLICSYPGSSIEIPNAVFEDPSFLSELTNFLIRMNADTLDAAPTSKKANCTVVETRDTPHPRYITELLTGILRSVGRPVAVARITKRVGDDVVWNSSCLPWRRSPLWLLLRVTIQTSLAQSTLGQHIYKQFMLFLMCHLANDSNATYLHNDLLQFMSAKISRRLRKLGTSASDWLPCIVLQTCTSLRLILEQRWEQIQVAERESPPWSPSQLCLNRDIELSLSSSGGYIRSSLTRQSHNLPDNCLKFEHCSRGSLDKFLSTDASFFEEAYRIEPHVALYDVEWAVEQSIDTWVDGVTAGDKACKSLEILAEKYSTSALKTYGDNPERLSVMLLTAIELWIALDKIAIKEIPMLANYSPEVPTSLLEQLLLSRTGNLHRLQHARQYLLYRHSQSYSRWSVFSPSITANSFAVRFYQSSANLQDLKSQIEVKAQSEVSAKVAELAKANACHAALKQQADQLEHTYTTNKKGVSSHAKKKCSKCSLEREYGKMEIIVHEWPLPADQLRAEAVVFELNCPISFSMWRAATFHLLVDLCSPSVESKKPHIQLNKYTALSCYLVQHPRSRVTLASDTKPFVVTHYSKTSIPTTQQRVCVNNGLTFYGFDSRAGIPVSPFSGPFDIQRCCTYRLQNGPYQNLQKYVDATSHTSNEILANQADCHKDISIHEYIAFGHLRSGDLLQWLNILRELRGRSLSFGRREVHFLLAQAASQVGPLDGTEWMWHKELQQPNFCNALLGELENLAKDVEANWQEGVTMDTISFLLRRLLAASPDSTVSSKALELLRMVRNKVFLWVEELSAKLTQTPGDEEFRELLRDMAAVCRGTFDVDPSLVHHLLYSPDDVKIFLSSAMLIHYHTPSDISRLSACSRLLLDRNRRLSLALEKAVGDVIQADPSDQGINLAVAWVWPDYRPGTKWSSLQSPNSRCFSCNTALTADRSVQKVHLNLLDGSLLVNGKPLGRLPNDILRHPLYKLIFGDKVLDVMPSGLSGIDYSARGMISGHQVYFSLRTNSDLVIKAQRKPTSADSDIIELIPQDKLKGDLPAALIEGHAHWLNPCTCIMEIRPLTSLWETSLENWSMDCTPGRYRLQKGDEYLIDIRSKCWTMVSQLLQPLDDPQNLLVSVASVRPDQPVSLMQLTVSLPRYGLSFYVDEDGDLRSHNMRGMVYDENQSIGTLFGLVNRLVLRPKVRNVDADELIPRRILIPDGKVTFKKDGHHVRVEVHTPRSALERITYQTYKVNTDLGYLTGNVSLANKLYCVYLHALTNGCGVDPLTGRFGTEEALTLLRSASCSSIMRFGLREAELLGLIASICPTRTWYPPHLKSMQKVEWHNLPAITQHHELYVASKAIKEHYERVCLFLDNQSTLFRSFPVHDDCLLQRSAIRAAYLSPSKTLKWPPGANHDANYSARDLIDSGEQRAYIAATTVRRRSAYAKTKRNILSLLESWKGSVSGTASLSLKYDTLWLAPDLPLIWLQAYKLLRNIDDSAWFQLLFSLPAMAYASSQLSDLVPVFVAFARDPQFRQKNPPSYVSYDLSEGYRPCETKLQGHISKSAHPFERSPESSAPAQTGEKKKDLKARRQRLYNDRRNSDTKETVQWLMNTWPCETPPQCSLNPALYRVSDLTSNVRIHFSSRYRNLKLKEHFTEVQKVLNSVYAQAPSFPIPSYTFQPSQCVPSRSAWSITSDQLFTRSPPSLQEHTRLAPCTVVANTNTSFSSSAPLGQLLDTVEANAKNKFQRQYVSALRISAKSFQSDSALRSHEETSLPTSQTLAGYYAGCRDNYIASLNDVKRHLAPRSESELALAQSGQWPRVTAHALFRCLASNSSIVLPDEWKKCLVRLALLALELQRSRRLLRLCIDNLWEELRRELQNEGCDGWDAQSHPDWLLIQLQGNLLVRRVQAKVASEMISPQSGSNTAMQLNMGEGKSSVIVPIVVSVLADGVQLVRVIVPKALAAQMFNILAERLGGLVNRRIYFLPFSRYLQIDHQKVAALGNIMAECMKKGGVLVVQPEHILSLKLVSVEKQLSKGGKNLAEPLLRLQRWLHSHSRDILDESDEILHVRYQLVYTIGLQRHMEGFPDRWTTTEQILGLVSKHAPSLHQRFPLGVEYECGPPGSFPHFRILHAEAGQELISRIVQDVIDDRLSNFNFGQLRSGHKHAIRNFISCEKVSPVYVRLVKEYSQQTPMWGGLLLLRGLLSTGILLHAFGERRWRVDYGLAPTRTMLAVPYRAKDVPAQRAEFGHPDIAIVLTCLSYYYGGLNEEQLRCSFDILFKRNDPLTDYNLWIESCSAVPEYLRNFSGVNIKSSEQWNKHLFPLFNRNRATVDFYLSNVVFPKEAKEFPSKLSCSGWDLAEKKERLLTGFSGTNDGQYLLPLHIIQRDPRHQRGTNAKVLSYLLQSENQSYMCMTRENGERRTTREFLGILAIQEPEVRVLLDVGAQMLDLENRQLAEAWLSISANASAAIYFNEDDELTVVACDGTTHPFISSPFAQQLDQCIVYLDDAHTRGTDIKFPTGFRAAVTLGPKVTKDRLAQGCMRMRKLGLGHSLMFFAPIEIDRRIRFVARKDSQEVVDTMDILQWAIRETCDDIQHQAAQWAQQGVDHASRYRAWTSFCANKPSSKELSDKWLQPEAKGLEDLYGPRTSSNSSLEAHPDIREHCTKLGILTLRDVNMDEEQEREQEREVNHEVERERRVERPRKVTATPHSIHPDVVFFVKKGVIPFMSKGFCRAIDILDTTSAAINEPRVWSSYVLATIDFGKTVLSWGKVNDFLRPVMWVVSAKIGQHAVLVILSPYEVNALLPHIRSNNRIHLHLYTPRTTKSMKPCDDLALYTVPAVANGWAPSSTLADQLNVFAGQLYLKDYETYIRLCRFLHVYARDLEGEEGIEVGCDGFISPHTRPKRLQNGPYTFQTSPLGSVKTLMALRRKGLGFTVTHMGKLVDGRLLSEDDFRDD